MMPRYLGSCRDLFHFLGKDSLEPFHFIVIVQQHHWHHLHRLLAKVALHAFSLKVLQESIRKPVLGPLAPCFFLSLALRNADSEIPPCPSADRVPEQPSPCGVPRQLPEYAYPFNPPPPPSKYWMRQGFLEMLQTAISSLYCSLGRFTRPFRCLILFNYSGNLSCLLVSNVAEDARTSHPCESGAGLLKATQEAGAAKSRSSLEILEVCDARGPRS